MHAFIHHLNFIVRHSHKSSTITDCSSCETCPSVRIEQLGSHWTHLAENLYRGRVLKFVNAFRFRLCRTKITDDLSEDFSTFVISGFRRDIDEICTLLGYYAASNGNPLPTFWDNVSGPIRCPETSVQYYNSTLRNALEERRSQFSTYLTIFVANAIIITLVSRVTSVAIVAVVTF
jgi:hypothetical protein